MYAVIGHTNERKTKKKNSSPERIQIYHDWSGKKKQN